MFNIGLQILPNAETGKKSELFKRSSLFRSPDYYEEITNNNNGGIGGGMYDEFQQVLT
jgi:hypothetical protein